MSKYKLLPIALTGMMLLIGCGKIEKGTAQLDPEASGNKPVATGRYDDKSYESIVTDGHYLTSPLRGLNVNLLNSNENTINFERGLLELSKEKFATSKYYFQEGQTLGRDQVLYLVERKSDSNPNGLNPEDKDKPYIFQNVMAQDFLDKKTNKLAAMSLGIALNSVDYSAEPPIEISDDEIQAAGKVAAEKILAEVRKMDGLSELPIMIGLFKQSTANNIAGGAYFAQTFSEKGKKLTDWSAVSEEHVVLLGSSKEKNSAVEDGLESKFSNFKTSVEEFFPNNSGVSGTAHYREGELQKTVIKIETKYFGETEMQNYVQYVARATETLFNVAGEVEVQINSLDGPEGFVKKKAGEDKLSINVFN